MSIFLNEFAGLLPSNGNAYNAPSLANRYVVEIAIKQLGLPSLYALAKAIDHPNPQQAANKWGTRGQGISGYYMVRILYLQELQRHDPAYWTPLRLTQLDWETIEHHPQAIPLSVAQEKTNAKRQNVLSAKRSGVPLIPSRTNRPIAV